MNDDQEAIRTLLFRYAECIDLGDAVGFGALFERGTLQILGVEGTFQDGAEAVTETYRAGMRQYDGTPNTKHVITNELIEITPSGIGATARCYFTIFQACADFPLQPIAAGRYLDKLHKHDSTWYFTERVIALEMVGDLSRHVTEPLATEGA